MIAACGIGVVADETLEKVGCSEGVKMVVAVGVTGGCSSGGA